MSADHENFTKLFKETKEMRTELQKTKDILQKLIHSNVDSRQIFTRLESMVREIMWGQIFHESISDCNWLKSKSFSPGRWAAGYPLLYVLYRVLTDIAPIRILELGLGQTTHMIAQYAAFHKDCSHIVVEHDQEWIDFFSRSLTLSPMSFLLRLNLIRDEMNENQFSGSAVKYDKFAQYLRGQVFDLILIDGPYGGQTNRGLATASRTDIIELLPGCLAPFFVILIDDAHRLSEQKTIETIKAQLTAVGISHASAIYSGEKSCELITSKNQKFLCSL